ncbi:hypothetical protein SprV_0501827400 [Sparganum proliferum]
MSDDLVIFQHLLNKMLNSSEKLDAASFPSKTPEIDRDCQKAKRDVQMPPAARSRARWTDVRTPTRQIAAQDPSEQPARPTPLVNCLHRRSSAATPQSNDAQKPSAFLRRKAYDAARRLSIAASSPLSTPQGRAVACMPASPPSRPVFKSVRRLPRQDGTPNAAERRLRDSKAQQQRRRATRSAAIDRRRGLPMKLDA